MHELDHHPESDSRYSCDHCQETGIDVESREYCSCELGKRRMNLDRLAEPLRHHPFTNAMWVAHHSAMKTERAIAAAELALLKSKLLQKERELAEVREDAYQQANPHATTYPAEIWLQVGDCDEDETSPYYEVYWAGEMTWSADSIDRFDVKYVRADNWPVTMRQVDALLSDAAALVERQGQQWISVEDRLPDYGVEVLVYQPEKAYKVTSLARFTSGSWEYFWDNVIGKGRMTRPESVTHWMPLPAAPSIPQDGQKSEGV